MLGPVQLCGPLGQITLKGDAEQKVLVRLAMTPGNLVSRSALRDQLWPGGLDGAGNANVRRGLSDLRAALRSIGALDALQEEGRQGTYVGLCRTTTDVVGFRALAAQNSDKASLEAMALVRGRPFDGVSRSGGAWIDDTRRILVAEIDAVLNLQSIVVASFHMDDYDELLRIGRLRLDLDAANERGLSDVVTAHYELGDLPAALQAVETFPRDEQTLSNHMTLLIQRIRRNLAGAPPDSELLVTSSSNSAATFYAAGEFEPNPVFHSDLLGDAEVSDTYVFVGADVAPLLGRLLVRQRPLERLHVVMLDPGQLVSVGMRVDEILETHYHRYNSPWNETWRVQLDLLATIVGLFDLRQATPVDIELSYHGTRDTHLLDTAAYLCPRRSAGSRAMLHPEARRYDPPSHEYVAISQKIESLLQASRDEKCCYHFAPDHTDADLLAMFANSKNVTIHAGNLQRLQEYAHDIAHRYADELRRMRSIAHHHRH